MTLASLVSVEQQLGPQHPAVCSASTTGNAFLLSAATVAVGVQPLGPQQGSAAAGCSVERTCRAGPAYLPLSSALNSASWVGTAVIFLLPFALCACGEEPSVP